MSGYLKQVWYEDTRNTPAFTHIARLLFYFIVFYLQTYIIYNYVNVRLL